MLQRMVESFSVEDEKTCAEVCHGSYSEKLYGQVEFGENLISSKYIFHLIFHWKSIYYGLLYIKTCLGI